MLTDSELGNAIKQALEAKGLKPADVARKWKVAPPSVQGWYKTGRIATDKLLEIMDMCADVYGPEHWGLRKWPGGGFMPLTTKDVTGTYRANISTLKPPIDPMTAELMVHVRQMSPEGIQRLTERAAMLVEQFPRAKANQAQ